MIAAIPCRGSLRRVTLLVVLLALVSRPSAAQTSADPPPANVPPAAPLATETPASNGPVVNAETLATLQERIAGAELSDADRARAVGHLDKIKEYLANAQKSEADTKLAVDGRLAAPARVEHLKAEKASLEKPFEPQPVSGTSVEIDQALGELRQQLTEAEALQQRLKAEPEERAKFKVDADALANDLKEELKRIEADLKAETTDPPEVASAFKARRRARRQWIEAQLKSIEARKAYYATTVELLALENEVAPMRVARIKRRVANHEEALKERKAAEADQAVREAARARRKALELGHEELERLALENEEIAKQYRETDERITPLIERAKVRTEAAVKERDTVSEAQAGLEEKLEIPDVETALGQDLVRARLELPHMGDLRHEIRKRNAERARIREKKDEIELQLRPLDDMDAAVQSFTGSLDLANPTPESLEEIEAYVHDRLRERKENLTKLVEYHRSYLEALKQLNIAQLELIEKTEAYAEFLDEHSRWVRSADAISLADLARTREGVYWLLDRAKWERVVLDLGEAMYARPVLSPIVLLLVVVLTILRERLRRRLNAVGELAARSYTAPYTLTLEALACTVAVCVVWPLLTGFVGWTLWTSVESARFSRAVGVGLLTTSIVFVTLEFVRQLFRSWGLANAHFHWKRERIVRARTHLRWLTVVGLPSMFVIGLVHWDGNVERWSTLGRFALILELLLVATFAHLVFRPVSRADTAATRTNWQSKLVHYVAAGTPLLLAVLTFAGYQSTTWRLLQNGISTVFLVLGVSVGQGMLVRWLYYSRSRLALQQIRQRKEDERADQEAVVDGQQTQSIATVLNVSREPEIDLATVNQHSRALVNTCVSLAILVGFWFIWYPEIPRLGILDRSLGSVTVETTQTLRTPDGGESLETITELRPITVADAILAVIAVWVTFNLAKNVPGLLEVLVLQYLPMDSGGRYAASSMARYVITVVGIAVALGMVGVGWDKVQWLVAALSIGLGFGLQELFANFVCGLILLFERPIRVGDIVTVGETTGVATKIQIRATTIRDWDRKEYIVPNKELITGRLLNWTLTDTVNRVVIKVGVAYGSDTDTARQLLFEILRDDDDVMDDPVPLVTFEGFGDSTLDFVIRCYLPNLDNRLECTHRLHTTIHRRFNAAGIEIAFPQRDIHVRTVSGVDAILGRADAPASETGNGAANGNGNGSAARTGASTRAGAGLEADAED